MLPKPNFIMKKLYLSFSIILILLSICYLSIAVLVKKTGEVNTPEQAELVLVLGARAYVNNELNPCLVSRVKKAVNLYKKNYASKLLMSGGVDKEDKINEAKTMRDLAIKLGVPKQDILIESQSTSTYENLLYSKRILKKHNINNIIIVTEPFHSLRASLVAKKQGINAISSPTQTSVCAKKGYLSRFFLKEPLAIMIYKLQNKL